MFRNLNAEYLGILGRQSELIELALTFGFRGLDLDVDDFVKRAKTQGLDQAMRFLSSAKLRVGSFQLPVRWRGSEALYQADLHGLDEVAEIAAKAKAGAFVTDVLAESDELPYHENFEQHRTRLTAIGEVLAKHKLGLGVAFHAAASRREGKQYQFIQESSAMATLLKSVSATNVGLWLDTWDWYVGGGDLESLKAIGANRVFYVALADAPADTDRASLTDQQRLMPFDEGPCQVQETLGWLNEGGYKGPVTLAPDTSCFEGMTRENVVRACSELLDEYWKTLGIGKKLTGAVS